MYHLQESQVLRYLMDLLNLNIRQCRWIDVVNDYECEIMYHPRKANVVADALSHKSASTSVGAYV